MPTGEGQPEPPGDSPRVYEITQPSHVLGSQTVKDLVAGSGFTFEAAGEHELKGVPDRGGEIVASARPQARVARWPP